MQKRYFSGFKEGDKADVLEKYPDLWPVVDYGNFVCGYVLAFCHCEWDAQRIACELNFLEELKRKHLPSSEI